MKTLEIVANDLNKVQEVAGQYGVVVLSTKLISKCHLVKLEGTQYALWDFVDEFYINKPDLAASYTQEILAM